MPGFDNALVIFSLSYESAYICLGPVVFSDINIQNSSFQMPGFDNVLVIFLYLMNPHTFCLGPVVFSDINIQNSLQLGCDGCYVHSKLV